MPTLEKFTSEFTLVSETRAQDMQSTYPSEAECLMPAPPRIDLASTRTKIRKDAKAVGKFNPELIIKAFNTWAFKREQPGNPERLVPAVEAAMRAGRPLEFVLYWGKGPRAGIAAPDLACLDYLAQLAGRVRQVYAPGALFRLIFTDTHASLNGHPAAAADAYFGAIDAAAQARGFASTRLSDVVAFAREIGADTPEEEPSGEILASLIACAAKWYRGEGSTEQGALDYHRMNMVEKRAVAAAFPEAVFVTFNGSEFRDLFPATMPIFYMYSLRRGVGVKPWFMDARPAERPVA
jgi:L-tyrosine isonitrile synthase